MKQFIDNLIKHQALFLICIGILLCIAGASGDLSFGKFTIKIPDMIGRIIAVTISLMVIIFGIILEWKTNFKKNKSIQENDIESGFSIISNYIKSLKDEEIKNKSLLILNETKERLRRINEGIVILGPEHTYYSAIEKIRLVNPGETVLAIHTSHEGLHYLYAWEDIIALKNYFDENIKAIEKGIKIERVFIIKKSDIFDVENNRILDERSLSIIRGHEDAGVNVYVTWFENIPINKKNIGDFIIFNESIVENHEVPACGLYYQVSIKKNEKETKKYISRYNELKNSGLPINKAFEELGIKG